MFTKSLLLSLVLTTATLMQCNAFTPLPTTSTTLSRIPNTKINHPSSSSSQLNATPDLLPTFTDPESARKLFFLWFFGASGGGGIAVGAFPGMYDNFQGIQSLKGEGPTLGGEKVGISPLCGYPEDLYLADVEKILNNKMTVETMVKKGPKDSFWAEKGYLRLEAFQAANKNCNPLAVRAVFDAMTTSVATVSPIVAQEKLDSFKNDINAFKTSLLLSKAKGYSAIGFLLFLLGIAAATCAASLKYGWFPEWPGDNLLNISDYWI